MTQDVLLQLLAEWGPWGIVGAMLFRCIKRQDSREDRLAEVIANLTAALTAMTAELSAAKDRIMTLEQEVAALRGRQ